METKRDVTSESLRLKDAQIALLSGQNTTLTETLARTEADLKYALEKKFIMEEELSNLKRSLFEIKSRESIAESNIKTLSRANKDKEKRLEIFNKQNTELLRILEDTESTNKTLEEKALKISEQLDNLQNQHKDVLAQKELLSENFQIEKNKCMKICDEMRIMHVKTEELKLQNKEIRDKAQVEVESMSEHLLLRKQKQYELLEKLHQSDQSKQELEATENALRLQLKEISTKFLEIKYRLGEHEKDLKQSESLCHEKIEGERALKANVERLFNETQDHKKKILQVELERNDNAEQVKTMAQKVFELLERLKLSEIAKSKALTTVRQLQNKVDQCEDKHRRTLKKLTDANRNNVGLGLKNKNLCGQLNSLKTQCNNLSNTCRNTTSEKLSLQAKLEDCENKNQTLNSRISFLLQKLTQFEEGQISYRNQLQTQEAKNKDLLAKSLEFEKTIEKLRDSVNVVSKALKIKQTEFEVTHVELTVLKKKLDESHKPEKSTPNPAIPAVTTTQPLRKPHKSQPPLVLKKALKEEKLACRDVEESRQKLLVNFLSYVFCLSISPTKQNLISLSGLGLGEDECHAISSIFRINKGVNNTFIMDLRQNSIDDTGARALQVIFDTCCQTSSPKFPKLLDLRGNPLTERGIIGLANSAKRIPVVKHVYIHNEGKIEAFGTTFDNGDVKVETLFVIDCRESTKFVQQDVLQAETEMKPKRKSCKKHKTKKVAPRGKKQTLKEALESDLEHKTSRNISKK